MYSESKPPGAPASRGARRGIALGLLLCGLLFASRASVASAQVSPVEIVNPQLKAAEQAYFSQLKVLGRDIQATKFPFPFFLSRYVGLDPQQQVGMDARGIEFVEFHGRVVLKITGNYNAAYNAGLLTENQRAAQTFQDVMVPILGLVAKEIPPDVACDAVGFEVSYHVRWRGKNSDYEGKQILVVVFDKADAFRYLSSPGQSDRQEILNRSEIYVDGRGFGLALGERNPIDLEALGKTGSETSAKRQASTVAAARTDSESRLLKMPSEVPAGLSRPPAAAVEVAPGTSAAPLQEGPSAATQADVDRLQAKDQTQLDSLARESIAGVQFTSYAPPSFVLFRNQIYLQVTLRNPLHFDKGARSIYKRAAQSFDLFLAPRLKALLDKLPPEEQLAGLDITLVNRLGIGPDASSEALEFALPLRPLRQFLELGITNQDLINQSIVLVNGVRIALNLQQVE